MQNQELINWIKSEKAKGFSDSELKKSYLEFGGSEVLYNMAMAEMNKVDHLEVDGSKKKYITWLVICIFITLVIGMISYFIWDTGEAVIVTKKINVNESSISCVTEGKSYLDIYPLPEKECCDGLVKGLTTCEKCIGEGVGISDDGVPCCEGLSANNNESKCRKIEENNLNSVLSMDTSTWQTYRSEEGKFEFMYPSYMSVTSTKELGVENIILEDANRATKIVAGINENLRVSIDELTLGLEKSEMCDLSMKNIKIGNNDAFECNGGDNIILPLFMDLFWAVNNIPEKEPFEPVVIYNILNSIKFTNSIEERTSESLNNARLLTRDAKRQSDLKVLQAAIELYISDNGVVPAPKNKTNPWGGEIDSLSSILVFYLPGGLPKDPSQEELRQWVYCFNPKTNKYMIANSLEQNIGIPGDLDIIGNWDTNECIGSIKDIATNVSCKDENLGSIGDNINVTAVCLGSDDLE